MALIASGEEGRSRLASAPQRGAARLGSQRYATPKGNIVISDRAAELMFGVQEIGISIRQRTPSDPRM
ncbi:hypothetical protein GCM10007890_37190 [Methylobacterium tardum]|uniref:Uncharacterized protein n=1 Tax=Methylobacterium tardum TaxID=374432 RepID=A0AA37TDE4_9HYPH|nr:hypothetical protein GCM10007890_37190 [Methylobacterium tardum]